MKTPRCLLLVGLALLLSACAPLSSPPPGPPPSAAQGEALYQEAAAALLAGRHAQARAGFQGLAASPACPPELARRARYGLAATALAAARTPQEAAQALDLWRAWVREAPPAALREDPRLLGPLVEGLGSCLAAGALATPGDKRLREDNARLQDENARLRRQLADLETLHQEMNQRKNRLGR